MVKSIYSILLWILQASWNIHAAFSADKFTLHTTSKNYWEAQKHCMNNGGRLVKICRESVFQDIVKLAYNKTDDFWIGLTIDDTRPPTNSSYRYEDGESAHFYRWLVGEPDKQLTDQCVRVRFENEAGYRTMNCNAIYDFVCERRENSSLDFKSAVVEGKEISELNTDNLCSFHSSTEASKLLCSISCTTRKCDMFGFNGVNKSCQLFRDSGEPCTDISYDFDFDSLFFMVDYGDSCV